MARFSQRFGLTRYDADENYKLALDAYRKRQFDEAILKMNEAIDLLPTRAEYYATRGFIYLEDGEEKKAQEDFQQALKLNALEMLAHYGRGMIAYNSKNWDEALAHFKDAFKADPQRPETLYYLALTYHRKGDNPLALAYMEQAAASLDKAGDKRKSDAQKWQREFQRQIDQQSKIGQPPPPIAGQQLQLLDGASDDDN
ncbi:MAG: tetratricopeptide repeat protein [Chloroflexi bacterium]|nr:tetratricopeptide repeat protein [Chloroflexota bacterium]